MVSVCVGQPSKFPSRRQVSARVSADAPSGPVTRWVSVLLK